VDTLAAYKGHLTEIAKLSSVLSLLGWDLRTHMPKKGVAFRSQVTGKLAKMRFERTTSDELGRLIEELERRDGLSDLERGSVRRVGKDYRRQKAVPPALVEEFSVARSNAQAAWASAREASAFADFAPHLEKMVGYARRFAEFYGYEDHPYDALLEGFEPGMTCVELREIIEPLRDRLVPLLARLMEAGTKPDATVFAGGFDVEKQRGLARRALEAIGYDFAGGALDDVAHPFTTTIGPGDVRVTNRYAPTQLGPGLFAALHEGGHALYNQGMDEQLFALGLAGGASNGIHESQSRMIENQIGRSLPFWEFFQPILAEVFPQFADVAPETLYAAANVVSPSLIRVEADEVTYNFQTGLIDGSIGVEELPRLWNDAMESYLGVTPPDDARGVLQDVHWSMGAFGYFPSYMLGNLYAAQIYAAIRERIADLDDRIRSGDFGPLLTWLRENVHRHGAAYEPKELVEQTTGETLDPGHFVRYVTGKFGRIYGI
jgi:carboxypeptidase Taq